VNYFDTAYMYHRGESEIFAGEALKRYPRDSFNLATKLPVGRVAAEADTDGIFYEQLKKTQAGNFDFYLMHGLNGSSVEPLQKFKIYENMLKKKAAGEIRHLGFSFHGDHPGLVRLLDTFDGWEFVQIQINYLDYGMHDTKEIYDTLCERGIPIIVMEPVRGGVLANPPESVRALMQAEGGSGDINPAGWALRWCLGMKNFAVILSGMTSMQQVKENLDTFSNAPDALTASQAAMLDKCREVWLSEKAVPCTGCRYCMDCPSGVEIPRTFAVYNEYKMFKNRFRANDRYNRGLVEKGQGADKCVNCGACVKQCPQGIAIPEELAKVHEELVALAAG